MGTQYFRQSRITIVEGTAVGMIESLDIGTVPTGIESRKHRRVRRQCLVRGRYCAAVECRMAGKISQVRRGLARVSVKRQMVGPDRIHGDQDHIGSSGLRRFCLLIPASIQRPSGKYNSAYQQEGG